MKMVAITLAVAQALCPDKVLVPGKFMEAEVNGRTIWYSKGELSGYSTEVQKFIVLHECGHAYGQTAEIAADTYAFHRIKVTQKMVKEMCRVFNTSSADLPRCSNLKRLYNESIGRR